MSVWRQLREVVTTLFRDGPDMLAHWLERVAAGLKSHEHKWVTLSELGKPYDTEICTAPYCDEERRITR